MKKIISIILSVLMILSSFSILSLVSAKENNMISSGDAYSGTTGDCTWKFDEDTGIFTVSGNGSMYYYYNDEFDDFETPWKSIKSKILSVVIEPGVTRIGSESFENCTNLVSASIPSGIRIIDNSAFAYCENLKEISIPNGVWDIGSAAFYNCKSLKEITLPESITTLESSAFAGCSNLFNINIPKKIDEIESSLFSNCTKLQKLEIPYGVKRINEYAFANCKNLNSISIPYSVSAIEKNAFLDCSNLDIYYKGNKRQWKDIDYIKYMPNNINVIFASQYDSGMVGGCYWSFDENTGILDISGNDGIDVTNYTALWDEYITEIKYIKIEDGVISIGANSFSNCPNLINVDIPKSVSNIYDTPFENCPKLTNINVDIKNEYYSSLNGDLYNKKKTKLIRYAIGKSQKSFTIPGCVKEIATEAFLNCSNLKSITLYPSVKNIDYGAFENCKNIKYVYFKGNRRQWCTANIDSSKHNSLNNAKLYLSTKTDSGKFGSCKWSFNENNGLLTISGKGKMGNGYDIPWEVYKFEIKNIKIGNGITYISDYAFSNIHNISIISLPNSIEKMGSYVFASCSNLRTIIIPASVKAISYGAFYNCSKLINVRIPISVKSIGEYAFDGCNNLKDVYFNGSKKQWKAIKIEDGNTNLLYLNSQLDLHFNCEVTKVTLNKKSIVLKVKGKSNQKFTTLKVAITPKSAINKKVKWFTSNAKIATVNSKGKVTAKKKGTCYVTVTAKDGSKKSAKCKIVVK